MSIRHLFVGLVVMLAWAGPLRAQSTGENPDAKARYLYKNGEKLYTEGQYGDAIAAWKRAYALSPRPLLLFNIANAQERLGQLREARDTLNRYRAFAPPEERTTLERRLVALEERILEQRRQPPPPVVPAPVEEVAQPRARPSPAARAVAPKHSRAGIGPAPIALYAVSGASTITGTVFAWRAMMARQAVAEVCKGEGAVFCPTSADVALRADRTSSLVADVGFGVAIVTAITGTALIVTSKNRVNRTTLSLAPAAGGASLGVFRRF